MTTKSFEVLHPIRLSQDEPAKTEGIVRLAEDEAESFLARGVIRPLLTSGDGEDGGSTTDTGEAGDNTPKSELAELLGEELAAILESAGYTSAEQVRGTSSEELDAINGVGPKSLQKIRAAVDGQAKK